MLTMMRRELVVFGLIFGGVFLIGSLAFAYEDHYVFEASVLILDILTIAGPIYFAARYLQTRKPKLKTPI